MNKHHCPYCMTPVPEGESCSVCGLTAGTYVPSPHHLPPGTILLKRYLVGRVLGEGGFGITYIGCDLRLELKVAIKEYYPVDRATRNASASLEVTSFIGPSEKSYERGKRKFLGEAQVMARMEKQQAIVGVRDFFELNNTAYIVMEYIDGITFRELVEQKGGKIPPEELFPMIEPLFHALSIMHENGLIHRDISPDNLMLENGKVRLLDFGCAREASRGTETMTIALKHGYAPIEQYQQKGQGPWTDIYALCATIYYCLTGKTPPQALDRITEDGLLLPSKLGINLSVDQERALLKGMRIQPNRRFSTAEELRAALYAAPKPPQPVQTVRPELRQEEQPKAEAPQRKPSGPEISQTEWREPEAPEPGRPVTGSPKQEQTEPETAQAKPDRPEPKPSKQAGRGRSRLLLAAAVLVCLAVIAGIIWKTSGVRDAEGGDDAVQSNASLPEEIPAEAPELFANAYTFTSGDEEEFQNLMKDDSVEAVLVDCDFFSWEISVTKPVRVEENMNWTIQQMTITDTGYVQVEGGFYVGAYLRIQGNGSLIAAEQAGFGTEEGSCIWMDADDSLVVENKEDLYARIIVLAEEIFDSDETVSVKDMEALAEAAAQGRPVSIDADLDLTEGVDFSAPVRISEGVTVNTLSDAGNYYFNVGEGGVLINNGTFYGGMGAHSGGAVINNNTLTGKMPESGDVISIWFEDGGTLLNFGTIHADDTSRMWTDALFLNFGTLNSLDFDLVGGDMVNFGSIVLVSDEGYFGIWNGSMLDNRGLVTVAAGAEMDNSGWIYNEGDILIEGRFKNAVLENNGSFVVEKGADIEAIEERPGIYYGSGDFQLSVADIEVYHTDWTDDPSGVENIIFAENAEELAQAMENSEAEAVWVAEPITMDTDLVVKKTLYIDGAASLTLTGGAALTDYGEKIILVGGSVLQAGSISLYEKAALCMQSMSTLAIDEGGSLLLDNSILAGVLSALPEEGGSLLLKEAGFILKNGAACTFPHLSSFETEGSSITLQSGATFVPSCRSEVSLLGAELTVDNADYIACVPEMTMEDCSLNIGENGVFTNAAENLILRNCTVEIMEGGELFGDCANLSLLSGTTLDNRGSVSVSGWDEYTFVAHGKITNYGDMNLIINCDFSEPVDNQGNMQYGESAVFSAYGNEPVPIE